jgi:hypothetical protein
MIETTPPRLSSGALAQLEAELRAIQERRHALARLAGVEDEAAAYPVREAIRAAVYELDRAEALITTNVGQTEALKRLERADQHITAALSLLRQAAEWEA